MPCGLSSRKYRESGAANTSIRNAVKFKTVRIFKSNKRKYINIWARKKKKKNEAYVIFIGDGDSDLDYLWVKLKERKKCKNTDAYAVALGDRDFDWDNL